MEPGWRGDGGGYRSGGGYRGGRSARRSDPAIGPVHPRARADTGSSCESSSRGSGPEVDNPATPGERFARAPEAPFVAGEIADRGPLERGAASSTIDTRAREGRSRTPKAWRDQAARPSRR